MSDKSSNVPNARSEIVREICCSSTSDAHSHEYLVVPLSDEAALQIFGSRVFDVLRKRWLEDDYLVREIAFHRRHRRAFERVREHERAEQRHIAGVGCVRDRKSVV